ncbi:MAG: biotin carboxylase N-terminal domain-containing protein, partial [Myxococcota bacterium]
MEAVAFYTEPDREAPFVRFADDVVALGAPFVETLDGVKSVYCAHAQILAALRASGCDAVWPGWGFVSEDADFVSKLEAASIAFLGPSSEAMKRLGDKIASKKLAEVCDVPLAPWCEIGEQTTDADAKVLAEGVGYPLMIKASAGGGGRGIRRVVDPNDFVSSLESVRVEAERSFGAGGIFVESCIEAARHIEVQFVVCVDGVATALGVRDCSIQRRHQKVIEETPSPVLHEEVSRQLEAATCRLAEKALYRGVGTAEFLFQPAQQEAMFLEVNSRLQVEHTVTEMVAGCDLVKAQIDIARGLAWEKPEGPARGHAIEVRLNAEDPERGFLPSPGRVRLLDLPAGPGVRVDCGIREDMMIASEFDSMIAKVMAWGQTRSQARARLFRALKEMQLVLEDGATNKAFLLSLLEHPAFVEATADTRWLDGAVEEGTLLQPERTAEALAVAAIIDSRMEDHARQQNFFAQVQNGIPQKLPKPEGIPVRLRLRDCPYELEVFQLNAQLFWLHFGHDDGFVEVRFELTGAHTGLLYWGGESLDVLFAVGHSGMMVEVDGHMHTIEKQQGGVVKAPVPALVIHVAVEEGAEVKAGDLLCRLEAMKMEMPVLAQEDGIVRTVSCRAHQQVHAGQPLVMLEPLGQAESNAALPAVFVLPDRVRPVLSNWFGQDASALIEAVDQEEEVHALLWVEALGQCLQSLLLGYDVPASVIQFCAQVFADDGVLAKIQQPSRWRSLLNFLRFFTEIEVLFEQANLSLDVHALRVASSEHEFYDLCRHYHVPSHEYSSAFQSLLMKALKHFGLDTLEEASRLREVLWRLARAHRHHESRYRMCSALLRLAMSLDALDTETYHMHGLRETLELVARLSAGRVPSVADNAQQAIYVLFERPNYVQRTRERALWLRQQLQELAQHPVARPHTGQPELQQLVESTASLLPMALHDAAEPEQMSAYLVLALVARLYLGQSCTLLSFMQDGEVALACVEVVSENERSCLGVILAPPEKLDDALQRWEAQDVGEVLQHLRNVNMVEVFLAGTVEEHRATQHIVQALANHPAQEHVLQWNLSWSRGVDHLAHRTYRLEQEYGYREDALLRDIHPEAAARLELWRLQAFNLERLPAPEHLYAFRATAKENPKDIRIFVFGEVYDLPKDMDAIEDPRSLWQFEQVYYESLRILREQQSKQTVRRRLYWNRVQLYIRPVMNFSESTLMRLAHRFEGPTRGLGIEKVVLRMRTKDSQGQVRTRIFVLHKPGRHRLAVREQEPSWRPIRAITDYEMKVVRAR